MSLWIERLHNQRVHPTERHRGCPAPFSASSAFSAVKSVAVPVKPNFVESEKMAFVTKARIALVAIGLLLLAGCAVNREFSALKTVRAFDRQEAQMQINDEDIRRAFDSYPQLKLPAKVAIFEKTYPGAGYEMRDNEMVETISRLAKEDPMFAHVVVVSGTFAPTTITPKQIRLAAARYRADLTLFCENDFRVKTEATALSLLDLTLVGTLVVPSRKLEVESRVAMHLIDTRNGHLHHSDVKTKSWKGLVPTLWGKSNVEKHRKELAEQIYGDLTKDLRAVLTRMAMQPTPVRPPISKQPTSKRDTTRGSGDFPRSYTPVPKGIRYETTAAE